MILSLEIKKGGRQIFSRDERGGKREGRLCLSTLTKKHGWEVKEHSKNKGKREEETGGDLGERKRIGLKNQKQYPKGKRSKKTRIYGH